MQKRPSIFVCRQTVLAPGLFIMTRLAKALPITPIPEQLLITSVWFFMVNHRSLNVLSVPLTNLTQRMLSKISFARSPPCAVVSALVCRASVFRMQRLMLSAVFLSISDKHTASRMLARCVRSVWHIFISSFFKRNKGTREQEFPIYYFSIYINI